VTAALQKSGLNARYLELELTESILMHGTDNVLQTVRGLKEMGVEFSIDDFGTGYSSLAYLKRFEVDKLKIDQSFVRDLQTDPGDAAIVRAIIQMAHALKLKTIAEGVETEEQRHYLQTEQCDVLQGYLFAEPMPADQFLLFLQQHRVGAAVK
jgi:EAL domain-containing protein (putative c-di-GMP-specific phosphodiesterase class I)